MAKNDSNIGKTKGSKKPQLKKHATKKGKSSTYNTYMTEKLALLKLAQPTLEHRQAMKEVLAAWKAEQKGNSSLKIGSSGSGGTVAVNGPAKGKGIGKGEGEGEGRKVVAQEKDKEKEAEEMQQE